MAHYEENLEEEMTITDGSITYGGMNLPLDPDDGDLMMLSERARERYLVLLRELGYTFEAESSTGIADSSLREVSQYLNILPDSSLVKMGDMGKTIIDLKKTVLTKIQGIGGILRNLEEDGFGIKLTKHELLSTISGVQTYSIELNRAENVKDTEFLLRYMIDTLKNSIVEYEAILTSFNPNIGLFRRLGILVDSKKGVLITTEKNTDVLARDGREPAIKVFTEPEELSELPIHSQGQARNISDIITTSIDNIMRYTPFGTREVTVKSMKVMDGYSLSFENIGSISEDRLQILNKTYSEIFKLTQLGQDVPGSLGIEPDDRSSNSHGDALKAIAEMGILVAIEGSEQTEDRQGSYKVTYTFPDSWFNDES